MTIPVAVAELIGTFLETFSYGVYAVIFPKCLGILPKRDVNRGLMFYLLATMWISFVLITLHLVVDLVRAFKAFTGSMDLPGSPEEYYANVNTTFTMTKIALYASTTLLSDILLVYRTYIIWGRKFWVVILPALLLGLDAAMSVWFTWSINQASSESGVLVSVSMARSKYFYVVTLALNLVCTFLIGLRIWNINHKLRSHPAGLNRRERILSVILESAAIYTAILVGLIGTSVAGNSAQFCFLNLVNSSLPPEYSLNDTYIHRCRLLLDLYSLMSSFVAPRITSLSILVLRALVCTQKAV
ncbi:hypothetical protein PILCRDRAFT_811885 [Piloderma croceum F 1598]|uniref:Uncharacterized protein n=1 Tax=Piloderma croceum (strain F 1598) TaxID=765440 RepID=A0A0C3GEP3_PILCF|nr:hypothetical protein PILCRDRAFT_811885 [Piloderma croceum F 1598]